MTDARQSPNDGLTGVFTAIVLLPADTILTIYIRTFQLAARNNPIGVASFSASGIVMLVEVLAAMPYFMDPLRDFTYGNTPFDTRIVAMIAGVPLYGLNFAVLNWRRDMLVRRFHAMPIWRRRMLDVLAVGLVAFVIFYFFWSMPSVDENMARYCQHMPNACPQGNR
jgi:hypothetical protein